MVIVSQDRLSVINFDNVATLDANIPECPNQLERVGKVEK